MEKYGRNHPSLAVYHDLLAKAYSIQGHYSRSRAALEEVLQIHTQNSNQRGIAYALHAKSVCYTIEKKYDEAIRACNQAVVIFAEIHGTEQHSDVGKQLYRLALIYYHSACARSGGCLIFYEVQKIFKRALAILEATLGNDHKWTMDCQRKLTELTGNQQQQEMSVLGTRPNEASGSGGKQQQAAVITID